MKKTAWKKKIAAWALCALLACALFPASIQAASQPLWQPAFASHYGRSDIRAYLNGGLKMAGQKNFAAQSGSSQSASPFEGHFTSGERSALLSSSIAIWNEKTGQAEQIEDVFYLPAGDAASGQISWAPEALFGEEQMDASLLIPQDYWAAGENGAWLRTSAGRDKALFASADGKVLAGELREERGVAAVCKVSLAGVQFAAAADARSIAANGGALCLPQASQGALYLKALDETAFSLSSCRIEENVIRLEGMQNAKKGAYVVFCAYASQSKGNAPVFMDAQRICQDGQQEISLPISALGQDAQKRLSGYRWSIWMETPAEEGEAFSRATAPLHLNKKLQNQLVFAEADALSSSWCEHSILSTGGGCGCLNGQAICLGRDTNGQPLCWWICARQEEPNQSALVLYQRQSAERSVFDAAASDYPGTEVQFPEEAVVVYGQKLGQAELKGGNGLGRFVVSSQESLDARPGALDNGALISVDFIPDNPADYAWNASGQQVLTRKVPLRVVPALVWEVQFPDSAQVRYGEPLSSAVFEQSEQSGSFAFANGSLMLDWEQDGQSFDMLYSPADTDNYDYTQVPGWDAARGVVVRRVQVHLQKGVGKVETPMPEPVEYDAAQALLDVPLPEGWAWEQPDAVPSPGTQSYAAVYTPRDTQNYDYSAQQGWDEQAGAVRREVQLVVAKASPQVQTPQLEAREFKPGEKLADVALPEGWAWADSSAALRLGAQGYVAVYTPADTSNYSQVSRTVQLEVTPGGLWREILRSLLWVGLALLFLLTLSALALVRAGMRRRKRG